jgi:predicted metal-dependent hydrolase
MGLGSHKTNISLKPMTWAFGLCKYDRQNISFALRAFSYSKEIVDYLIVHELAHIKYFHHQKDFWQYVQQFIPNCWVLDKQLKY